MDFLFEVLLFGCEFFDAWVYLYFEFGVFVCVPVWVFVVGFDVFGFGLFRVFRVFLLSSWV